MLCLAVVVHPKSEAQLQSALCVVVVVFCVGVSISKLAAARVTVTAAATTASAATNNAQWDPSTFSLPKS